MGTTLITIRPFQLSDVSAAAKLERSNQPRPWTEGVFKDELEGENRSYLVAELDGLVGFAGVMVVGDEAHVTNLLVAPTHRRQGVGGRLLRRLVEDSIEQGARHLTLEVRSKNDPARALYSRFGLAPVGTRPGYYEDDDALILWVHDIASAYGGGSEFAKGERRDRPGYVDDLK